VVLAQPECVQQGELGRPDDVVLFDRPDKGAVVALTGPVGGQVRLL
jgi:hypothetical protein